MHEQNPSMVEVPVIRGRAIPETAKEFQEKMHYESGRAESEAAKFGGSHDEPWLNVMDYCEPGSIPGFEFVCAQPELRARMRGAAIDVGAGTCWLSAKLTRLPEIDRVFALDLSERFIQTVGTRIMKHHGADLRKVTFVVSDFNEIPLESESLDCAFVWAAIHHSLTPIKTLREVGRCLKKGGTLFVFEAPTSILRIRQRREYMLSVSGNVTEIAYTRGELEYLFKNAQIGPLEVPRRPIRAGGASTSARRSERSASGWRTSSSIRRPTYSRRGRLDRAGLAREPYFGRTRCSRA